MSEIPRPGDSPELETLQTPAIAELPDAEAPEAVPFKISFEDWNESECEIDGLKKPNAGVALKVVRDIGVSFTNERSLMSRSKHINEIKFVMNQGHYKKLYKGLSPDVEVKEVKCKKEDRRNPDKAIDFRLFFYTIEDKRTFYILAIRQSHYDIDK